MSQSSGASSGGMDMIHPQHIDNIPILNAADKEKYKAGLEKLWLNVKNNPADTEIHQKAVSRIKEVSKDLMLRMAKHRNNLRQQQQNQQNAQQAAHQASQQALAAQQNAAQAKAAQQEAEQAKPAQQPQMPTGLIPIQNVPLSAQAQEFLRKFEVAPLPGMLPNTPEYTAYRNKLLGSLQRCLMASDRYGPMLKELNQREAQYQQAGQTLPQDQANQRDKIKATIQSAKEQFDRVKAENETNRRIFQASKREAAGAAAASSAANGQGPTAQNQTQSQVPQQGSPAPQVKNEAAPQQAGITSQPNSAHPPPTPQSALPQQQNQQQRAPQQARPQPVPQQQPFGQQGSAGSHAQALSHQDAINAINRTYSDQIPQAQPQSAPTSRPAGTPTSATATSSAQPFAAQQASSITSAKMPIPAKAPTPGSQPVQMAPGRPTIGTGPQGMMGQPALQRPPAFTLEGEEGRVLSKKKLDELVRQITGGGEGLSPEVEQTVLTLADDFVDNVLTAACRLAKIRPNATLDIRDVQLVLERNYNIRVPGYSLDEVRTVRKFAPAAGWQQKMNAVQAAKVMGKNDP